MLDPELKQELEEIKKLLREIADNLSLIYTK